ncbi:heme biosynthesis HemY N-terminal domain-containing protein [Oceanicoccus sp. KOV_DT_Chl]|uniref:heme biosynthesis HemY N-terminal domain-containing protein n=1 Tax=Oceanicoccus sp. KOV_DT_Chl TaxID=1904639 RepID=UPI000C796498|nr:heme biosynthesis HemY N-terminal domain-containing protein [Oceanicoccus sp. KOV_DT_Chl]
MKRLLIAVLIVLIVSALLVAAIEYDPGYVLISYGLYTIESTVWVGLGAFIVLFALCYGFFSVLRRAITGSSIVSNWISGRGFRRSQQQTTKGLIAFIEGNWQSSRNILVRAAAKSETPLINYLIAARASHALGDDKKLKEYLTKAEASASGASIAVGLTQAELQLRSGSYEQSLATLTRVRRNAGKHPHVLLLLKQAYQGLNDWQELLKLVPELKKYKVLSPEQLTALELTASKNSIIETAKLRNDVTAELHKLWKMLPKTAVKNSDVVAAYAERIIAAGEMVEAEKLIRKQLKKDWNIKLVDLYGRVEGEDAGKQLLHAESWLQERNNDASLLLCLGRLSLRNSLWGKAREYFEISLKLEESGDTCAELGRLLACLGEHEKSNEYFQQGLMLATHGLPQLPLPGRQ